MNLAFRDLYRPRGKETVEEFLERDRAAAERQARRFRNPITAPFEVLASIWPDASNNVLVLQFQLTVPSATTFVVLCPLNVRRGCHECVTPCHMLLQNYLFEHLFGEWVMWLLLVYFLHNLSAHKVCL